GPSRDRRRNRGARGAARAADSRLLRPGAPLACMAMRRSPARLVIALSVAAALAVFIVYTAVAGAGTPQIVPTQVHKYQGQDVTLVGTVRATHGDSHSAAGMQFALSDPKKQSGHVD